MAGIVTRLSLPPVARPTTMDVVEDRRTVVVVAYDRFQLLDLAGPCDVLSTATTLLGERGGYRVVLASPDGAAVADQSGIEVAVEVSLRAAATELGPVDTLMVVGGPGSRQARPATFSSDLRDLAAVADRVTSVCTGALVLAAAGLLDGYRATTHWAWCDHLARYPEIRVEPDRLHVHDRDRWTSAGVTAGIDLALALVEADHSSTLAHEVAGWLVVFARRPGGQAQFNVALRGQDARDPRLRDLLGWLPEHLGDDLTVPRLAARAGMSPRTFARIFRDQVGTTPAAHVEALRVEAARRLLETTDLTVAAIARRSGFGRAETLHRAFARSVGTTPDRYRQHHAHSTGAHP